MKRSILLFLLFFVITPVIFSQQRIDVKLVFDGADREFIVVKPSGSTPAGGYPVVFMFHGTSGDGEKFYNISGWKEKGEAEKFITVFPSSRKYCVLDHITGDPNQITKWNNGDLQDSKCPGVPQNFKDDVKFVRKMVDTLKATFNINSKMIFASGFSNGSCMAMKLAIDASDIFAAVAGSGALLNMLDSAKPTRKIPIWITLGTLDDRFTAAMGVSPLPFGGDTILAYLNKNTSMVLNCEGLGSAYSKTVSALTNTFIFKTPKPGETSSAYIFTLIKDLTHEYPNGTNYPFAAANLFWDFFTQSVSAKTDHQQPSEIKITAFPNPSGNTMTIECSDFTKGEIYDCNILNSIGQQVLSLKDQASSTLVVDKNDLGKGLFLLKLTSGQSTAVKRIVFE